MNIFMNQLSDEIKNNSKQMGKKTIKTKKYTIEKGILSWSNAFVPIRNVAIVSKHCDKSVPIGAAIIMIVAGILLLSFRLPMLRGMFIILGIVLFILIVLLEKRKNYYVAIKLISGDTFTIADNDEKFIDQIIDVLRNAAIDSSIKYIISVDERTIQNIENNGIINNGDSNEFNINNEKKATKEQSNKNLAVERRKCDINDVEWSQLQSYTERVMKSMDTTSTSYIIIEWMYSEIKKKIKTVSAILLSK